MSEDYRFNTVQSNYGFDTPEKRAGARRVIETMRSMINDPVTLERIDDLEQHLDELEANDE